MRAMSFTKLKAISRNQYKALGIPLYCTFTKIRLLYIAKIRMRIKISFQLEVLCISSMIFKFIRRHSTGTIKWKGECGGRWCVGWDRTVHWGEFGLHHYVD